MINNMINNIICAIIIINSILLLRHEAKLNKKHLQKLDLHRNRLADPLHDLHFRP